MAKRSEPPSTQRSPSSFPLLPAVWDRVAAELSLPPQQLRVVELLLRRMKCKEIAAALNLGEPTLRTYLRRIYDRLGVADQSELLIHIMALSHKLTGASRVIQDDDIKSADIQSGTFASK